MLPLRSKIPQRQRQSDWSFAYSHPDRWGNKSEPISHPRLPCPLGTRQVPPDRRAIPKICSPVRLPNVASSPSDQIGLRSSGWKDPKAAEKAGMSLMEYVIGGRDQGFKVKLYHALHAMDDAGLAPGITSAFRDDYRQSLASGLKASIERSYHGGSSRGGYGHGLAADLVSVKGDTRAERLTSSQTLWQWIDLHGGEFGIGRPYLDKDPPHVAPVDGKEYADHRRTGKPQSVRAYLAKHNLLPAWADHGASAKSARLAH